MRRSRTVHHAAGICRHISLVLVVVLGAQSSSRADPAAEDLLRQFETAMSTFEKMSFRATTQWFDRGNRFPSDTLLDTKEIEFVRIGERFRVRFLQTGSSHRLGGGSPYEHDFEIALNGDYHRLRHSGADEESAKDERWSVAYAARSPDDALKMMRQLHVPRILFGCYLPLDDDNALPQIMREAGVTTKAAESVDGHEALVITSQGAYGTHTLWLDPAANYLPRRIVNNKSGRDLYAGMRLNEVPVRDDPGHRQPNLKLRAVDFEVGNIEISWIQEIPVFTRFTAFTTYKYDGSVEYYETKKHVLAGIDFDPSPSELQLTMHIPDGTRVDNLGEDGIDYEWQQGEIVKRVNESQLARAGSSRFSTETQAGAGRLRMLIVVNVVAVIVIAAVVMIRRRRRQREL